MVRPKKVGALTDTDGVCRSARSHTGTISVDGVISQRL